MSRAERRIHRWMEKCEADQLMEDCEAERAHEYCGRRRVVRRIVGWVRDGWEALWGGGRWT